MEQYKITMEYLGGILSNNSYKLKNRATKPLVRMWMRELEDKVRVANIPQVAQYEIIVNGRFTDDRRPDLDNLHKVIGDSIKKGLSVDDKNFFFKDGEVTLGHFNPFIEITIIPMPLEITTVEGRMGKGSTLLSVIMREGEDK